MLGPASRRLGLACRHGRKLGIQVQRRHGQAVLPPARRQVTGLRLCRWHSNAAPRDSFVPAKTDAIPATIVREGSSSSSAKRGSRVQLVYLALFIVYFKASGDVGGSKIHRYLHNLFDISQLLKLLDGEKKKAKKGVKPLTEKTFVGDDGHEWRYYDDGEGSPTVVINATTKRCAEKLHREISRTTRCITFDHRYLEQAGEEHQHVLPAGKMEDRSVHAMAKEIGTVLRGTKVDSDVVLVSTYHNWLSTLEAARRNAAGVAGVVLWEPLLPYRPPRVTESDDVFYEKCLAATKDWAKPVLMLGHYGKKAVEGALGYNSHMLNPRARPSPHMWAVDALIEKHYHDVVLQSSTTDPFQLRYATASPMRYARAGVCRATGFPRWQVLNAELAMFEQQYVKDLQVRQAAFTNLYGAPFVTPKPDPFPIAIVASSFHADAIVKYSKDLFSYMARPITVGLPGLLMIKFLLPPSTTELHLRLKLIHYQQLRNSEMARLLPHATRQLTDVKPFKTSQTDVDVTQMDTRALAGAVRSIVKKHRGKS